MATSTSAAAAPINALYELPLVLFTVPVLAAMENDGLTFASPPQVWPSVALPQSFWLARWNVSVASTEPELGTVVVVVLVDGALVVGVVLVVDGAPCTATASRLANSSSNQI